ncbi:uncharacterized protein LOC121005739 [Bufo bufo]|uniref:uncharacterized protein LOC121005739 n=1 Tax=Bufo bufo TaxID=8384 RepID=UPI001ABE834D|nr:uncharacterized protein LOC121005739 [Bufo bufo]
MREVANSAKNANLGMNVPCVAGAMGLADVLEGVDKGGGIVLQKGQTPVRVERMVGHLNRYPNQELAEFLYSGFKFGFHIPSHPLPVLEKRKNLRSALQFPDIVTGKLAKEVSLGRMDGPFVTSPISNLRVSPLGLIPKKEPNKFRLIHHLSFPKGASVNEGIDPELCSVVYASFDAAVEWVRKLGPGTLLAKCDIEAAFRLLPVHPDSLYLLGCFWNGAYFVDRCLPMGCSISCAYFERFSSFLEWVVVQESGCHSVIHYLDDFLCLGPGGSRVCSLLLSTLQSVFECFGVPLAVDKTVGPATELSFLGIVIDTQRMECRLPVDKVSDLRTEVAAALAAKKIRLRDLQSLLGKLNFACRILPMGRIFSRRLASATGGVVSPHHFIRLGSELKGDLKVWDSFLKQFNGRALVMGGVVDAFDFELFTDAAGGAGFGAYCEGQWCAGRWPESWVRKGWVKNVALLELFPIVLAVTLWGEKFRHKKVRFHCDNLGVVQAINSVTASSPPVICLLQQLVLRCLSLNAWVFAVHVPGSSNCIADALSRFQWERFRQLAPEASQVGLVCPESLWEILEVMPRY